MVQNFVDLPHNPSEEIFVALNFVPVLHVGETTPIIGL